jgi:glycosyltransferase involved in cell wall biosynthesis
MHRILFCVPLQVADGGGLERYAWQVARRMSQDHDIHCTLVATDRKVHRLTVLSPVEGVRRYAVPALGTLSRTPVGIGWARSIRQIIDREGITLVNAHAPVPGMADAAARAAGRLPFVLTYHAGSMAKGRRLPDLATGLYERVGLRILSSRADAVIVSSDFVKEAFPEYFARKGRTISPGVDTDVFRAAETARSPELLFVGALGKSARLKGLDVLFHALAEVRRQGHVTRLAVCGGGSADDYQELARRLGIADSVRFLGLLDQSELAALYRQSRALVLPTFNDSFPMVLLEALACGLPVVTTDVGGLPTLVRDEETGLVVKPGDVAGLARAIQRISTDDDLGARLGAAGARTAQGYGWPQRVRDTLQVFDEAARRRESDAPGATTHSGRGRGD